MITLTEVEALRMDRNALRTWIIERPEIAEQLLRVLARRLRHTNNTLCDLIFTDVPARVAKQILDLAMRFGTDSGGPVRVEHHLTQRSSPNWSAPRGNGQQGAGGLRPAGWIRQQGKALIIDQPAKLARRARA